MKKEIALRIKELRIRRNFAQRHMAEVLGVCLKAYGNIENGISDPTLSRLMEIAKELDVELHELLNTKLSIEELLVRKFFKNNGQLLQKFQNLLSFTSFPLIGLA